MSRARTTRQELVRKVDEAMAALDLCFQGSERITLLSENPGRSALDMPRALLAFPCTGATLPEEALSRWMRGHSGVEIPVRGTRWSVCFTDVARGGHRGSSGGKRTARALSARG